MPVFATFFGSIVTALLGLFTRVMGFKAALKLAAYTAWLSVFTAFLLAVYVCMNSLYGMVSALTTGVNSSGIPWVSYFFMGAGMFIPANAGAVISCLASVWIGTGIYKFQKDAIQTFGA